MKIRFELDGDLPLSKILSILNKKIVTRSVFQEQQCYPQVCLFTKCVKFVNELWRVCNFWTILYYYQS